jgi:hypothetical protein
MGRRETPPGGFFRGEIKRDSSGPGEAHGGAGKTQIPFGNDKDKGITNKEEC